VKQIHSQVSGSNPGTWYENCEARDLRMTLLEDAAAIHAALGLPEAVKGVLPVAQAAAELMGTPFAHGTPLPVVLSELKKMIGITSAGDAAAAASTAAVSAAPSATSTPVRNPRVGKQPVRSVSSCAGSASNLPFNAASCCQED